MPNDWKKYKLSEVAEVKYGKDHKHLAVGEIPVFGSGGIMRYADKALYEEESVLIPRKGTLSNLFYLDKPFWSVDTMFYTKLSKQISGKYFYYNLKTLDLAGMDVGSAVPSLTSELLNRIEITLPSLKEQTAIAEILSALDDKIELNLQTNKTLEDMANALYKHWFVDFGPFKNGKFVESELGFIPEGWVVETFSNIYELKKGLSYKSAFYSNNGIPMINLKCVDRNGGFRYDGIKYYKGDYKNQHVVKHGDLLVAMTDLTQDRSVVGSPLIAPNIKSKSDVIASLDLSILKQTKEDWPNLNLYFYYLMRTKNYHEYILGFGNGSTVVHLDKMGIINYRALLPLKSLISDFNLHATDIRRKIELNIEENDSLTSTRDYLLPKLISGEIRVKEATKKIKDLV